MLEQGSFFQLVFLAKGEVALSRSLANHEERARHGDESRDRGLLGAHRDQPDEDQLDGGLVAAFCQAGFQGEFLHLRPMHKDGKEFNGDYDGG